MTSSMMKFDSTNTRKSPIKRIRMALFYAESSVVDVAW